jgi:hypothetical protein
MRSLVSIGVLAIFAVGFTNTDLSAACTGFIGQALCDAGVIDKSTEDAVNRPHRDLGNPLDHVPAQGGIQHPGQDGNPGIVRAEDYVEPKK